VDAVTTRTTGQEEEEEVEKVMVEEKEAGLCVFLASGYD